MVPAEHDILPPPPSPRLSPRSWFVITTISAFLSACVIMAAILFMTRANVTFHLPGSDHNGGLPLLFPSPGEKVILLMGVDANYSSADRNRFEGTRSDTMILARVSPSRKTVSVVSIPRDSKVYLAHGRGVEKINAAHAIGGTDLATQTVQESFGIPVDHFVVVNFRGVRELVDAIGGVRVYVEKPMRYRDRTAHLSINFQPGYHTLNGQRAEEFLRFRHDALADIGRIRRQQMFIAAVIQKLKSPLILAKLPQLVELAGKYIHTDLAVPDMIALLGFAKDVELEHVRVATLPGRPSGGPVSYWIIDPEPAQEVLDRMILNNATPAEVGQNNAPLKVGLLYTPESAERIPALIAALEQKNFQVTCKSAARQAGSTQIVEHTRRVTDETTDALRSLVPQLQKARLIFAPVGTTFESNACSTSEDYTVIVGKEIRS